jgi:mono/diheme cytochrome c family protein
MRRADLSQTECAESVVAAKSSQNADEKLAQALKCKRQERKRMERMQKSRRSAVLAGLLGGLSLVSAQVWAEAAKDLGSAVRGLPVYLKACSACHGDRGDGKGSAGVNLQPLPRDFTSGMYKFRSTPSGELPTDADLMTVIDKGVPGTQMPAWEPLLTKQERLDVLAYIKSLSEDFTDGAPAAITVSKPWPLTAESLHEGRMVYITLQCFSCHGPEGKGNGKDAKSLTDDWGHAIRPRDLTRAPYRAGHDAASIYRTFSTGLNGTPMPAFAQADFLMGNDVVVEATKLKEVYRNHDLDALRQWLQAQPGSAEIERMPEAQKQNLAEKRKWALAHYVAGLAKRPNFLVRMFTENTEVTP